jgi:hypothetical protein
LKKYPYWRTNLSLNLVWNETQGPLVSIAECIWPVKIVNQISLKRYNFQSLGKEQGGVEKEKGEAFNKFLREPGLPWKTFQSSSLSLSLSHELGALSLSCSS